MTELKAHFGKYKAMDVENYVVELRRAYESRIENLTAEMQQKDAELEELRRKVAANENRESVIARVMVDATVRAKEIEADYKQRAARSDAAYDELHREWVEGMQSCAANLAKLRQEAKAMLESIDGQFGSLCTWADGRLEALESASLPQAGEASLAQQIAAGAGADLNNLCREMGYDSPEKTDAGTETPEVQESTHEE